MTASTATQQATRLYVGSEVGTLRRVILHRPDLELRRLTPRNKDDLLFDDVLWVKRARQEHDAFADALAERGVEVLLLERLLAEALENPAVREDVLERTLRAANLKPALSPAARLWLEAMSAAEAAHWLIGGVAWDELPFEAESLAAAVATDRDEGFALPPLPEPHVHARHVGLDLRRRQCQRNGQAGPHARVDPPRGDLQASPALRGPRLRALERGLALAAAPRGRRHPRDRQRRGARRHGRAHDARRGRAAR